MKHPLERAIVRIFDTRHSVVGAGCLVAPRRVLTCAHIVAEAADDPMSLNRDLITVSVDFPLLAPGDLYRTHLIFQDVESDVAGLELERSAPEEATALLPVHATDPWHHAFRVLGFPTGYDNGVWASGRLLGRDAMGWLQVEDVKQTGYFIAPGFSGAPVWDNLEEGVVGIVTAAERRVAVRAAFVIPAQMLFGAWAELAQARLDADMAQEKAQRDAGDRQRRELRSQRRVVNLRPLDVAHTFKDRLREIKEACTYLRDERVRLISITGRGGMGKTALASRVLGDLEQGVLPGSDAGHELTVDGILYLSARSTGLGLERIYADIGRMLDPVAARRLAHYWANRDISLPAKVEYLLESMRDGNYLILLDNLEAELTPEGDIADEGLRLFVEGCLSQPGGARIVVTTRKRPNLPRAALGGARHIPLRVGLPEVEAVALLRELDPQGGLGLRNAAQSQLLRAARLTQGIPRALEILAGILYEDPTLTLEELLNDEALFGEQVVETLIAAGFRRLNERERQVVEALAVYDRPVTETTVAFLLHPWHPGLDMRDLLRRLVKRYFVTHNRTTGVYSLHPLDREYAYKHLPEPHPEDKNERGYTRRNLELRAAEYYASIRKPKSAWQTFDDLAPQLAEFEHYMRGGASESAFRVLEMIDRNYLSIWGYYHQLAEMRERLLSVLEEPASKVVNKGNLGLTYYALGRFREATAAIQEVVSILRARGHVAQEATWLNHLGKAYRALGQGEDAYECDKRAVAAAERVGNRYEEMVAVGHIGVVHRDRGDAERAFIFLKRALDIAREREDRKEQGILRGRLGLLYRDLGHISEALAAHREALTLARETKYRKYEASWLGVLGGDYRMVGQFNRSLAYHRQSLALTRELGARNEESFQLGSMGMVYLDLGKVEEALGYHRRALEIVQQTGDRRYEALWFNYLGLDYRARGDFDLALEYHLKSVEICREHRDVRGESYALLALGRTQLLIRENTAAAGALVKVLDLGLPWVTHLGRLFLSLARLCDMSPPFEQIENVLAQCRDRLNKEPDLYETQYTLATALLIRTLYDTVREILEGSETFWNSLLQEYNRALEITAAPGVVLEAKRDLELIQAAGIEGLEPVFELLESAEYVPDSTEDLDAFLAEIPLPEE